MSVRHSDNPVDAMCSESFYILMLFVLANSLDKMCILLLTKLVV